MTIQARFSSLARASHLQGLLALTMTLAGCLAPPAEDFPEPEQTPPFLDLLQADPPITEVVSVASRDQKPFAIPVRSEDRGERLWGGLHLDFKLETEVRVEITPPEEPSTLDDTRRSLTFTWNVVATPGCHQLALLVTHERNFDFETWKPKPEVSQGDVAIATWWVLVDGQPESPTDCPAGTAP